MTTRERLRLLAPVLSQFPELGFSSRKDLENLVISELANLDILDRPKLRHGLRSRALAPQHLYIVAAGNLPISTWQALLRGLLLGSPITLKLSRRQNTASLRFLRALPPALRRLVNVTDTIQVAQIQRASVVMAFGSNETLAAIKTQLRPEQRFIGYGHKVSFLWLPAQRSFSPRLLLDLMQDLSTYDQLGCLSPQALYTPPTTDLSRLASILALALEKLILPPPPAAAAAEIREARDLARARGATVLVPLEDLGQWTLCHERRATFHLSPGYRFLSLHHATPRQLAKALFPLRGQISTVGHLPPLTPVIEKVFLDAGVTRFCPVGQCQFPHPLWHHDGRPQLADMVTWIDQESRHPAKPNFKSTR
jgi:Acyl-CoA reductase (LuxC)